MQQTEEKNEKEKQYKEKKASQDAHQKSFDFAKKQLKFIGSNFLTEPKREKKIWCTRN